MSTPGAVPPGWYPDPGGWRWWDGAAWGPSLPAGGPALPRNEVAEGRTLAALSHVPIAGFVLPLVLYLVERDKNRFVRHHAAEALNLAINMVVVQLFGFVAFFVVVATTFPDAGSEPTGFPTGFLVTWLVMMATIVGYWALGIWAAVRASQGRWFRYPVLVRVVDRGVSPPLPG